MNHEIPNKSRRKRKTVYKPSSFIDITIRAICFMVVFGLLIFFFFSGFKMISEAFLFNK